MELTVTFPGNKRVDAHYKGFTIQSDQALHAGGDGSAPQPFDLFLASIATCSGVYVVYFCGKRGIPLDGISMVQRMEKDGETGMIRKITIEILLPPDFPEKYRAGLVRAVDLCTVKKHMMDPPEFVLTTVTTE